MAESLVLFTDRLQAAVACRLLPLPAVLPESPSNSIIHPPFSESRSLTMILASLVASCL